jgi:limonene-1,2-epoxide hydrolase
MMSAEPDMAARLQTREAENLALVKQFFADWSKRDVDLLATYLADDLVYQMVEGQPDILGKASFLETLSPVLKTFKSVEMKLVRHTAIAQLVVSERLDTLIGKDAAHSMSFSVASYSVVYDGKIAVLRDFPIRDGVFEIGGAFL